MSCSSDLRGDLLWFAPCPTPTPSLSESVVEKDGKQKVEKALREQTMYSGTYGRCLTMGQNWIREKEVIVNKIGYCCFDMILLKFF